MAKGQRKKQGGLSLEDRKIWKQVADTITPLEPDLVFVEQFEEFQNLAGENLSRANPSQSSSTIALGGMSGAAKLGNSEAGLKGVLKPAPQISEIDIKTVRKIAKGKTAIDRTLDLHGMTQTQAHFALENFLYTARAVGARTVLIITGKGNLGQGVLRNNVPRWLKEPPLNSWVSSFSSSASRHGGEGALYVRLRKTSNPNGKS